MQKTTKIAMTAAIVAVVLILLAGYIADTNKDPIDGKWTVVQASYAEFNDNPVIDTVDYPEGYGIVEIKDVRNDCATVTLNGVSALWSYSNGTGHFTYTDDYQILGSMILKDNVLYVGQTILKDGKTEYITMILTKDGKMPSIIDDGKIDAFDMIETGSYCITDHSVAEVFGNDAQLKYIESGKGFLFYQIAQDAQSQTFVSVHNAALGGFVSINDLFSVSILKIDGDYAQFTIRSEDNATMLAADFSSNGKAVQYPDLTGSTFNGYQFTTDINGRTNEREHFTLNVQQQSGPVLLCYNVFGNNPSSWMVSMVKSESGYDLFVSSLFTDDGELYNGIYSGTLSADLKTISIVASTNSLNSNQMVGTVFVEKTDRTNDDGFEHLGYYVFDTGYSVTLKNGEYSEKELDLDGELTIYATINGIFYGTIFDNTFCGAYNNGVLEYEANYTFQDRDWSMYATIMFHDNVAMAYTTAYSGDEYHASAMKFVKNGEESTYWPESNTILTRCWTSNGIWFLDGNSFTDVTDRYDYTITDVKDYHGIMTFKLNRTDRFTNEVRTVDNISVPGRFGLTSLCPTEDHLTRYLIEVAETAMKFTGWVEGDTDKALCIRFFEEGTVAPEPVFMDLEGKTYAGTDFFYVTDGNFYSLDTKIVISLQNNDIVKMSQANKAALSDWTFVTCGMTRCITGVSEYMFSDGKLYHGKYTGQFSDDLSAITITGLATTDDGTQMVIIFDLKLI